MSPNDLKFEVRLNGELLCRAGLTDKFQYLCAEISRVNHKRADRCSGCHLYVRGSADDIPTLGEKLLWLETELHLGDEISVRLVHQGELTKPIGLYRPESGYEAAGGLNAENDECDSA